MSLSPANEAQQAARRPPSKTLNVTFAGNKLRHGLVLTALQRGFLRCFAGSHAPLPSEECLCGMCDAIVPPVLGRDGAQPMHKKCLCHTGLWIVIPVVTGWFVDVFVAAAAR